MAKIEQGCYKGRLIKSGVSESKNKKTPFIYLTFLIDRKVVMGEDEFLDFDYERDICFYFTEKTEERTEKDLLALGFNGDYSTPKFRQDLYDAGTKLFCEHTGEGDKVYENWNICSLGGGVKEDAPKSLIQRLNAKWKAHNNKFTEAPKSFEEEVLDAKEADDIPY